jgi:hypothetical protein
MLLAAPPTFQPRPPPPRAVTAGDRFSTIAFDPMRDAATDLDLALRTAQVNGKRIIVIMGANWCHDSAALANLLDSRRFVGMINDRYEVVFVDSGTPQTGKGRNLDIAKRFGVKKVKSTPLVFVLSPDGKLLNSRRDAISWRNAASRSEDAIFAYFDDFTPA